MKTIGKQIRQHSVALISLVIALSSLGYNTWRNEKTEANRNIRVAGIELLLTLGELEQTVYLLHYDKDQVRGSPRSGWTYVLTIRDLATLMREPAIHSSLELHEVWNTRWAGLGEEKEAVKLISNSIDRLRADVLTVLAELD